MQLDEDGKIMLVAIVLALLMNTRINGASLTEIIAERKSSMLIPTMQHAVILPTSRFAHNLN
jgi:hypothetical protein